MGLPELLKDLESPNAVNRFKAATALYRLGPQANSAIPKLIPLLRDLDGVNVPDDDGNPRMVSIAERASLALAAIGEGSANAIIEELKKDNGVSAIHCVRALAAPALARRAPISILTERLTRPKVSPGMAAALCEVLAAALQSPEEPQRAAARSALRVAHNAGRVTQKFQKLVEPGPKTPPPVMAPKPAAPAPVPPAPSTGRRAVEVVPSPKPPAPKPPAPVEPPPEIASEFSDDFIPELPAEAPPAPEPASPPAPVPAPVAKLPDVVPAAPAVEEPRKHPSRPPYAVRSGRGDSPTSFGFDPAKVDEPAKEADFPENIPGRTLTRPTPRHEAENTNVPGHPEKVTEPTATFQPEFVMQIPVPSSRAEYAAGERFAWRQDVSELVKKGDKLKAVALLRSKTGASLIEALKQIDGWA